MTKKNRGRLLAHQIIVDQTLQKQLAREARALAFNVGSAQAALESVMKPVNEFIRAQAAIESVMKSALDWQKQLNLLKATQARLEFPYIIRDRLSVNPSYISTLEQHNTPSPELSPTAITPKVHEEIPPDTIPIPLTEPVLPKINDKAQNKRIFIGHGRSNCWKELRDFMNMDLRLSHDEFDCVPTAGLTTTERLQQMMDKADMAFLIMTAENQYADGTWHARENVVHEVGLFQAVLGFKKAIILLEEGCQEFSNIHGLSQIRFPKGNIKAAFEDIHRVLEREGIL